MRAKKKGAGTTGGRGWRRSETERRGREKCRYAAKKREKLY